MPLLTYIDRQVLSLICLSIALDSSHTIVDSQGPFSLLDIMSWERAVFPEMTRLVDTFSSVRLFCEHFLLDRSLSSSSEFSQFVVLFHCECGRSSESGLNQTDPLTLRKNSCNLFSFGAMRD